jgi:uncharacterized membrane protein
MQQLRRVTSQLFLLACSLGGAGIALYLTSVHYELAPLACSETGFVDCARVLSSSYSVVPGTTIPISIPGLGWCLVMLALASIGLRLQANWLRKAQFAWSLAGMLTVLYLAYVEIVLLHNLCAWCTALHVLIFLIFLVTLARLAPSQPEAAATEPAESEPAEAVHTSDRR